jgi:hypothetical protein
VQRKLLEMIFILYRNNVVYDKEYFKKNNTPNEALA